MKLRFFGSLDLWKSYGAFCAETTYMQHSSATESLSDHRGCIPNIHRMWFSLVDKSLMITPIWLTSPSVPTLIA